MDLLTDDDCARMTDGYCPDCGHRGFVLGPRGGEAINIECGNLQCRHRFNVTRFVLNHAIWFGQRIPSQAEGGSDWEALTRDARRRAVLHEDD